VEHYCADCCVEEEEEAEEEEEEMEEMEEMEEEVPLVGHGFPSFILC
jgi:hypothetical protein